MSSGPPERGGGAGSRRAAAVVLAAAGWWLLASIALAQSIGFTVQVIAVSDQNNAIDISRGLLREGFPAYVVRSTGGQGDVYRVRVGAFSNRAAAVRYAAAMPAVGGARPVPALAEAIPAGIMSRAPRVLWHGPVVGADLRVLPWPAGIALRRQADDPLRQARYDLIQGAEVRTVDAWRVSPLAALPPSLDLVEVPFVDLTARSEPAPVDVAAPGGAPADADADAGEAGGEAVPADEPADDQAAGAATPAAEPTGEAPPGPEAAPVTGAGTAAAGAGATEDAPVADEAPDPDDAPEAGDVTGPAGPVDVPTWADPGATTPEAGLLLLRDRSLWPPTWAEDTEEVRDAFRSATLALVANRVDLGRDEVESNAYFPGGGPPPALVVVELSDRSGRDLGDVRGLGDPRQGLRHEGPPPATGVDSPWWPVGGIGDRVPLDAAATEPIGGADWTLTADDGFVRITLSTGASWRAVAGVPLWSDGRYALVRDGSDVVLVDFLLR